VLEVELAGFRVISGLLDYFVPALCANKSGRGKDEAKLIDLFPEGYIEGAVETHDRESSIEKLSTYERLMAATDFVSGMTDSYAVDLYQKLSGIRLPT
jgi:dGTPase